MRSNTEKVVDLIELSKNGSVMGVYVVSALKLYSQQVVELYDPQSPSNGIISDKLWVELAKEVLEEL